MNTAAHGSNDTCEFYHIGFSLRFRGDKNETNEMLACFSFYKLSGSNKLQCCFCPPGLSAHYVTHQPNHLNTSEQHKQTGSMLTVKHTESVSHMIQAA